LRKLEEGRRAGFINVPITEAHSKTSQALRSMGWDEEDASLQADIMINAELCGNNQGLVKMYQPEMMAPARDRKKPTVERDFGTSAVINGNQSPGMVAAAMAADLAATKALEGEGTVSVVASYNTSTSSGQLGYYAERMAKRGVIGVVFANSPEFVSAAAGAKPVFGTNPLAVGMPTSTEQPFVFDMATSAIALFGVLSAKAKGEPLPPNVAYDKEGNWTTDAAEAMEGGIATFGGHKGAGLAITVELLAGALTGAAVLGMCHSKKTAKNWGHLMIAIRPNAFVHDFEKRVDSVIQTVKNSGPNIRIPGENSARIAKMRRLDGLLPVPENIWKSILNTAHKTLS